VKLRICKVTGRLDTENLEIEELKKLVRTGVISQGEIGNQLKYYANPFKFPEIIKNPTLCQLFGEAYPGVWKQGPLNLTSADMFSHNELELEEVRTWTDMNWPTC
jgi:hypothetical protein